MNESIKAKWLAALRSGRYTQGKNALHTVNLKTGSRFCCLGVLCDIVKNEPEVCLSWKPDIMHKDIYLIGEAKGALPEIVQQYTGVNDNNPMCGSNTLVYYNDNGYSFTEIADLIEKYL